MKKINFKFLGSLMLFMTLASSQIFAVDILLRKDNSDPGTVSLEPMRSRPKVTVAITAEIVNNELGVYFGKSVGNALLTIEDANGNLVLSEVLNTNEETEFYIALDELNSGQYKLKVEYSTTRLVGDFSL